MEKKILITLTLVTTFALGFAFKTLITKNTNDKSPTKKVTGIGGIFFKCKDPGKMREWYKIHLGLNTNQYGTVFEWRQGADTLKKGFTQWSPFKETTKYFAPSTKDYMINYRVENLVELVDQLKKDSVMITDSIETVEYGKFVHIMDMEGNKVELWEPNDVEYEKLGEKMGVKTTK
jgi:predicted enzyme related to lactoylglutathione lyase